MGPFPALKPQAAALSLHLSEPSPVGSISDIQREEQEKAQPVSPSQESKVPVFSEETVPTDPVLGPRLSSLFHILSTQLSSQLSFRHKAFLLCVGSLLRACLCAPTQRLQACLSRWEARSHLRASLW